MIRRIVSQQAVSLHALADQLQDSVRKWQAQPDQQDATVSRDMNLLEARCRELESLTAGGRNRDAAHRRCRTKFWFCGSSCVPASCSAGPQNAMHCSASPTVSLRNWSVCI